MSKDHKVKRVFPGGNTAKGFYSFFNYITGDNYTRRYIIKGGPGAGKSTFMSGIKQHMLEQGFEVEEYPCATDPDSLDAIFIPEIGVALLDGTAPHAIEPRNPGITDDIIWLGEYWDKKKLMESKYEILKLSKKAGKLFKTAFNHLREAGIVYDEWRSYAQDAFNEEKYNIALKQVMEDIFKEATQVSHNAKHSHFFASAISGKGIYNYTDSLMDPTYKVYAFSGMPGSGVHKAVGRIAQEAQELGLSTQQYHSPIDVNELDMVIIPSLKCVVVNVSQVLSKNNSYCDNKKIEAHINFDNCLDYRTIREYSRDIEEAKKRFYHLIDRVIDFISRAKAIHGQVEKYYVDAMDFERVNAKRQQVLEEIMELAKIND
ncbi:MAG: hypothetical protein WBI74_06005 [Caldicoprobacterales bacterium]|nr:hypothetical protein [Clostridiales bacterium]